jgi:hypothetical protein
MTDEAERDVMTKTDEVLLLDRGFEYGLSGTTLWQKDRDGNQWCVVMDQPGEAISFRPIKLSGTPGPGRTMAREEFGELFPR